MQEQILTVIIQWPDGLNGQPVILPVADTLEQEIKIARMIERALSVIGNDN